MHARTANLMQLLTLPGSPVVMFRCECGDVNCRRTIPMSPVSFREARLSGEPLLHASHSGANDDARSQAEVEAAYPLAEHDADDALRAEKEWLEHQSAYSN
jgi:hypothetical protein